MWRTWGRALGDRGARCSDPESVLLVDYRDREVAELDLVLDECVRADGDLHVPGGDELTRVRVLALRGHGAREQRDADTQLGAGRSMVRKCWSASVSVGAISAP